MYDTSGKSKQSISDVLNCREKSGQWVVRIPLHSTCVFREYNTFRPTTGSWEVELYTAQVPRNISPAAKFNRQTENKKHSWWNQDVCLHEQNISTLNIPCICCKNGNKQKSEYSEKNRCKDISYFTPKTFFFIVEWNSGVNVQQTKITPVSFWELNIPSCSNLIQQVTRLCSLSPALPGPSGECPLQSLSGSCRERERRHRDGKRKSILTTTTAEINRQKIHLLRSGRLWVTFQNSSSFQFLKTASRNFHFLLFLANANDKSDLRNQFPPVIQILIWPVSWFILEVSESKRQPVLYYFSFLNTAPCRVHVDEVINPSEAM